MVGSRDPLTYVREFGKSVPGLGWVSRLSDGHGEVLARDQGVGVLWSKYAFQNGQEVSELIARVSRVPVCSDPPGEVEAGNQRAWMLGAESLLADGQERSELVTRAGQRSSHASDRGADRQPGGQSVWADRSPSSLRPAPEKARHLREQSRQSVFLITIIGGPAAPA